MMEICVRRASGVSNFRRGRVTAVRAGNLCPRDANRAAKCVVVNASITAKLELIFKLTATR